MKNLIGTIGVKLGMTLHFSVLGSCRGSCSPVIPLSSEQEGMLKDPTTKVKFEQENPKSLGNKAYQRYENYKGSTTIQYATQNGANRQDLTVDFDKGRLVVEGLTGMMDVEEGKPLQDPPPPSSPFAPPALCTFLSVPSPSGHPWRPPRSMCSVRSLTSQRRPP